MSNAMEVILLERIDTLGGMGEKVRVKPGYARNFLLPQGKALRATEKNVAYFESQKAALEKLDGEKRTAAQADARKLEGLKVVIIRHASEAGMLYGSVMPRDVSDAINEAGKHKVGRNQVTLATALKSLGLSQATVTLHPEVKVSVTVNIARSQEEAKQQEKTGKAVIARTEAEERAEAASDAKAMFLDDSALEAEKSDAELQEAEDAEEAARAQKKAAKKPKKVKAAADAAEEDDSDDEE